MSGSGIENYELVNAGFYGEGFRAAMRDIREKMSLDEIKEFLHVCNELADCGIDPVGLLKNEVVRMAS